MPSIELYCTLAELRTQIDKDTSTGSGGDAALTFIIGAVSRAIDAYCDREEFGFVALTDATALYLTGSGTSIQYIPECVEVTGVAVKSSADDDEDAYTDWTVGTVGVTTGADVFPASGDPRFPRFDKTPYTMLMIGLNGSYSRFTSGQFAQVPGFAPEYLTSRGVQTVKVTAKWGYAVTVPSRVNEACIIESARVFKRGEGTWADAIATTEFQEERFVKSLDPATQQMLYQFRRIPLGFTGGR